MVGVGTEGLRTYKQFQYQVDLGHSFSTAAAPALA